MADNELFGNSEQLDDTISRRETVKAIRDAMLAWSYMPLWREDKIVDAVKALPSAQPNLSEAYSKAVFTWLIDYQIRTAELKGRYTPYEVLSWVINDWRKENG